MRKKKFDLAFSLVLLVFLHLLPFWIEVYEIIGYYLFIWVFLAPLMVFQLAWVHHPPFFVAVWRVVYNRSFIIKMVPIAVMASLIFTMYLLILPYIIAGVDDLEAFIQHRLWGIALLAGFIASLFTIFLSDERFEEETSQSEREY
ncbi:hypothetical protein [Geomicrobium sediminis]|uniref:Uncharacterized protein n=1 Tax=Geomicrobium sediminis TaxID=1347788 RepID=A0ABS2PD10_9BACL|nr:hypothetical protein [Geomicrobium sediminis]MBM7633197.1 hypothetical protein [Geomicrobium sediminis]